jgi:hypothetical protein
VEPQWQYALGLVELGYWVFPLGDGGKLPRATRDKNTDGILPLARELYLVDEKDRGMVYAATNDVERVKFWANRLPLANYGVACGPSKNVTIVDLDRHNPTQDGIEVIKKWAMGRESECKFWVETPSNGLHLYYKGFTAKSRTVVPGVECQNNVRYAAGPCCKTYKGMYRPFGDPTQIGEAPEWLKQILSGQHPSIGSGDIKESILTCVAQWGYVPEGMRHDAVFKEAVIMAMEDPDRDAEDMLLELRSLVDQFVPDAGKFTDDELKRNIRNAKRGMTNDEGNAHDVTSLWSRYGNS